MTREEKELLLIDLSARLHYGVMVDYENHIYVINEIDPSCKDIDYITVRIQDAERFMCAESVMIENVKPYLRPMSSMTEEEVTELAYKVFQQPDIDIVRRWVFENKSYPSIDGNPVMVIDWLNVRHFDYRGLIEKGLAIEAPEGMYEIQN